MSLYNESQNKCITFLTNYVNTCIKDSSCALKEIEFIRKLKKEYQIIDNGLIDSILNKHNDVEKNIYLLFVNDEGFVLPIRTTPIPIRATVPERSWLHYILQSPLASLFLDYPTLNLLKIATNPAERNTDLLPEYPFSDSYIDILRPISQNGQKKDLLYQNTFNKCRDAYIQKNLLYITGIDSSGNELTDVLTLVFKIEYDNVYDNFSLIGYSEDDDRLFHISLDDIRNSRRVPTKESDFDRVYSKALSYANSCLQEVILKVLPANNGYDRTAYIFSGYDRESFHIGGFLQMRIKYYPFQADELVEKILFLGASVKVLEPAELSKKLYRIYAEAAEQYAE